MPRRKTIGLDFDNTIIDYGEAFWSLARERGYVDTKTPHTKEAVKAAILSKYGNDLNWQELQALAYGPEIGRARLFPGVVDAIRKLQAQRWRVVLISHKTEFSYLDKKTPIREWAKRWIASNLTSELLDAVYFESEKHEKIGRIASENCTVYLDDLDDILADAKFPETCARIRFDSSATPSREGFFTIAEWSKLPAVAESLDGWDSGRTGEKVLRFLHDHMGSAYLPLRKREGEGNNRVFFGNGDVVVKQYSRSPTDSRDLGQNEFEALLFLRSRGVDELPKPLAFDPELGIAALSRVQGISVGNPTAALTPIAEFVKKLADISKKTDFQKFDWAVGPRKNPGDYLESVARRKTTVSRNAGDASQRAAEWIRTELLPFHNAVVDQATEAFSDAGISLDREFEKKDLILSPSDFGFHNILATDKNGCAFLDFEFFGWDDPAKLFCDFFHSVGPSGNFGLIERKEWDSWCKSVTKDKALLERAQIVEPVIGLEWVWICLNVFAPEHLERKRFVNPKLDVEKFLEERLERAKAKFHLLNGTTPAKKRGAA